MAVTTTYAWVWPGGYSPPTGQFAGVMGLSDGFIVFTDSPTPGRGLGHLYDADSDFVRRWSRVDPDHTYNGGVQIENGNVVLILGTAMHAPVGFEIRTDTGALVRSKVNFTGAVEADAAALDDGGFAILTRDVNSDIVLSLYDADGDLREPLVVKSDAFNTDPSVAVLADGSIAMAWASGPSSGNISEIWYAVYEPDGDVIRAPRAWLEGASIVEDPQVVALANGGFGIVYAENAAEGGGSDMDVVLGTLTREGEEVAGFNLNLNNDPMSLADSRPNVVVLSNGLLAVSYAAANFNEFRVLLVDPSTGAVLADREIEGVSSLGGLALFGDNLVAALSNGGGGGEVIHAQRVWQGDSLANVMNGDSMVDSMRGEEGADTLNGLGGDDLLGGGADNDVLNGARGNDALSGGTGADTMRGGLGNDGYDVDVAGDKVIEAANAGLDAVYSVISYTLGANVEDLILVGTGVMNATGNELNNRLGGNDSANNLRGGSGNDTLYGNGGADIMTGGSGADRFVLEIGGPNSAADTIVDFASGADRILLEREQLDGLGPVGTLTAARFHVGAAAHDANDRIIYNAANGNLYYDGNGDGAGARVLIAKLDPGLALTHSHFQVLEYISPV